MKAHCRNSPIYFMLLNGLYLFVSVFTKVQHRKRHECAAEVEYLLSGQGGRNGGGMPPPPHFFINLLYSICKKLDPSFVLGFCWFGPSTFELVPTALLVVGGSIIGCCEIYSLWGSWFYITEVPLPIICIILGYLVYSPTDYPVGL